MCAATYIEYACVTRRRKHNSVICMCLNFVLVYIPVCACVSAYVYFCLYVLISV